MSLTAETISLTLETDSRAHDYGRVLKESCPTRESLMYRLVRGRRENRLDRILQQLASQRVPILDERWYLPLTREEVKRFLSLLVRRSEPGAPHRHQQREACGLGLGLQ